ncbi:AAA family ATPase, partial [Pseudomonas aeruginosa]
VTLAQATRQHPYVYLGASPRGSLALMKAAQAYTLLKGRTFVTPDDVQYLAPFVFAHRLILKPEARYDNVSAEDIIGRILLNTAVPTRKSETL